MMQPETKNRPCPKCSNGVLMYRVRRAGWVKRLLGFLPLKRYSCSHCRKRSYVFEKGAD